MSLKAKLEAVIYAAEEPVTLAQLVGLLGGEGTAELARLDAQQGSLPLELAEGGGAETAGESADAPDAPDGPDGPGSAEGGSQAASAESSGPDGTSAADGGPVQGSQGDAESDRERRAAREQERRVREFFRDLLGELQRDYATGDRGLEVREVAGGYRMATKPEYHDAVRGFVRGLKPVLKLTLQALETLAVVAYKQPVTAPEVSEIRGVDSGGVLGSLLGRKLVATAGRKQVIGRPILYRTTKDFLLRFGLRDLSELPSIEEFEKLAGALAAQEEMEMPPESEEAITAANLEEERDAVEPQADGDSSPLETDGGLPVGELPSVEGRVSGLDPDYDAPEDDPSAQDAAVQSEE